MHVTSPDSLAGTGGRGLLALVLVACVSGCGATSRAEAGARHRRRTGATGPTPRVTLVRIVDGDTIRVRVAGVEERVRYIGMNTPEMNEGARPPPPSPTRRPPPTRTPGSSARAAGSSSNATPRSATGTAGSCARSGSTTAGRWTLVNLVLVEEGFAQVSTYPPDVKYVDALLAAQPDARAAGRGLCGRASAQSVTPMHSDR